MSPDALAPQFDAALFSAQAGRAPRPEAGGAQTPEAARAAAEEFESFFLAQTLNQMQQGIETAPPFGGGPGEKAWRSFLSQAMADEMVSAGGIGLADSLVADMIALQAKETP